MPFIYHNKEYDQNDLFDYLREVCLKTKKGTHASKTFYVLDVFGEWYKVTFVFNVADKLERYSIVKEVDAKTFAKYDFPYYLEGIDGEKKGKPFQTNNEVMEFLKQNPQKMFRLEKKMPDGSFKPMAIEYDNEHNWIVINRKIHKLK